MRKLSVALLVVALLCAGCSARRAGSPTLSKVTRISVWHPWGGTQKEKFEDVVAEFNRTHDRIQVRAVFTPNDLSNNQKFFTAVVAKRAPDVTFVDGQQTAAWAEQGALAPLDGRLRREGIVRGDYFAPCWDQNAYRGRVWALTFCADPNFAFVWNKKLFRQAGLDPDRAPETIDELDRYNRILTRVENGDIVRMGVIPWGQYGSANSLFTWGWSFGGDFYDPKTGSVTATDPGVVRALEWMVKYSRQYDVTRISAFMNGFGSREQNPFYIGKVAMQCMHISSLEEMRQYAPDLDYGIGYIPAPADGEPRSSWVGGWCLAIPRGSRHPEAAWEFIRWACRDPRGTDSVARIQGLFPGYRHSPYFDKIRHKKGYGEFLRIMQDCRHQRPVMPAQAFYMTSLGRAVEFAIYGRSDARTALAEAARDTQAELDLRLAGR